MFISLCMLQEYDSSNLQLEAMLLGTVFTHKKMTNLRRVQDGV